MFFQLVTVALCALVAQPVVAGTCSRTYTIKQGDFCNSICAANGVSTYQLAVNNLNTINANCSNLQPGGTLCLGSVGADCHTTHVVVANDTCDIISSAAGINNTMLTMNNPQINADCSDIYIGEVLCTAKTLTVTNPPSGSYPKPSYSATSSTPAPSPSDDLPYCDEL